MKKVYGYFGLILLTIIICIGGINLSMSMINAKDTFLVIIGFWLLPMVIILAFGIVVNLVYKTMKILNQ